VTSVDFDRQLNGLTVFGELLHLAGAAAANADSPTHRAIAVRDIDRLGTAWTGYLPTAKANIADAIIATVHALAGATCAPSRCALVASIRQLVTAARTEQPMPTPRRVAGEPRRYWIEADQ